MAGKALVVDAYSNPRRPRAARPTAHKVTQDRSPFLFLSQRSKRPKNICPHSPPDTMAILTRSWRLSTLSPSSSRYLEPMYIVPSRWTRDRLGNRDPEDWPSTSWLPSRLAVRFGPRTRISLAAEFRPGPLDILDIHDVVAALHRIRPMARDSHPDNLGNTVAAHVPDRSPAQVVELQFGHAGGGARLPPGKPKLFDRHSVAVEHGRAAVRILVRPLQPMAHVAIEDRNRPAMPGLGIRGTQRDKALLPVHLVPSDRKQFAEPNAGEVARQK